MAAEEELPKKFIKHVEENFMLGFYQKISLGWQSIKKNRHIDKDRINLEKDF